MPKSISLIIIPLTKNHINIIHFFTKKIFTKHQKKISSNKCRVLAEII